MEELARQHHWENVYREKGEYQVSWFQETPAISLELLGAVGATPRSAVIDVGGGASRLVDALVEAGYGDVTVLDLSEPAIAIAKARLGERTAAVAWSVGDVTRWEPSRSYDVWHDRAAFHFLTEASDRTAYAARLTRALRPGGHAVIGTFAMDGPERCSGLPVVRYDAARLSATLGDPFVLVETRRHEHQTPMGGTQRFQFSVFRRV
jgi:trans-aconitate methyltransferase